MSTASKPPQTRVRSFTLAEHYACQAWGEAAAVEDPREPHLATVLGAAHELVCSRKLDNVAEDAGSAHLARDTLTSLDRLDRASARMRAHFEAELDARLEAERVAQAEKS
ncbi:MAG: hypothetical protein AAGI34_05530 [Pseudomonadota bacterium]